jgi:hypothetical protein
VPSRSPEIASHIAANGLVAGSGTPEDFAAFLKRDKALWTKVIATGGIKGSDADELALSMPGPPSTRRTRS